MKVAVVGTGAAGLGVLSTLAKHETLEIIIFEVSNYANVLPKSIQSEKEIDLFYSDVYRRIRTTCKFKFPPPKTHFGNKIPKYKVEGKEKIFKSESMGGLTNYWGGTALPFTDKEFEGWPVGFSEMRPFYEQIANTVGISGIADSLNSYFHEDFVNCPPIEILSAFSKLAGIRKNRQGKDRYDIHIGINRCMVETRNETSNRCVSCGECLAGCFRNSIFSSIQIINELLSAKNVTIVFERVSRVDEYGNVFTISEVSEKKYSGFDRIYICAGCPNTTEIVMRSRGVDEVDIMCDNAVYVFPILNFSLDGLSKYGEKYLSLNNSILAVVPTCEGDKYAQALLYPNFDYMWRFNTPAILWPYIKWLFKFTRNKVLWARLYVHGDYSQAYSLKWKDGQLNIQYAREANKSVLSPIIRSIRKNLNTAGYWVPPIPPILQKANSHYASTIPYGGSRIPIGDDAQIFKGVYICDSSVFPSLPAVPLTFTIMANAARIAHDSLLNNI